MQARFKPCLFPLIPKDRRYLQKTANKIQPKEESDLRKNQTLKALKITQDLLWEIKKKTSLKHEEKEFNKGSFVKG